MNLDNHQLRELEMALDDTMNSIKDGKYGDIGIEANVGTLKAIKLAVAKELPEEREWEEALEEEVESL